MNAAACLNSRPVVKPASMPAEPFSHAALILFLPALASVIGAAQMTPNAADAWAAAGALFGTFIAAVEASQRQRCFWQMVSVCIASTFCGVTIPGLLVNWFYETEAKGHIAWQAWAQLGFVSAILGWGIVLGLIVWSRKSPEIVVDKLDALTHTTPKPKPDTDQ